MPVDHKAVALLIGKAKPSVDADGGHDHEACIEAARGLIDAIHANDPEAFLDWRDKLAECDNEHDADQQHDDEGT